MFSFSFCRCLTRYCTFISVHCNALKFFWYKVHSKLISPKLWSFSTQVWNYMFDWTEGTDTRCNIACNVARNVAGVEASSTSATFHTTIAPCVHPIACNVARNVASCVRSLSHLGVKQATGGQNIISCNGATVQIHCLLLQARFTKALV